MINLHFLFDICVWHNIAQSYPISFLFVNQIEITHYFWLFSTILTLLVVLGGIIVIIITMREKNTLKTGAGPWLVLGMALTIPPALNEIFDELEIILSINFYPNDLYLLIFNFSSIFLLFAAISLVVGVYRQFLVGEKLKEFFPYQDDDVNELSDDISMGE